ncbi:MAG TPA: hypothetical protein VND83_05390 [Acidimicrobiales bacterium]|nr:hypothetical protein [Acidimicrobiales bacterium]
MMIVPLVVGALSYGLITVFSLQNSVSGRLADSGSAQVLEATFLKDVQSAAVITENQPVWCQSPTGATQTQLLGLAWNGRGSAPVGYQDSVSYVTQQIGTSVSLIRQLCTGSSRVAADSTTIASDLKVPPTTAPAITCIANTGCTKVNPLTSPVWLPAYTVSRVTFTVYETLSPVRGSASTPFEFVLTGTPRTTATVTSNVITVIPPYAPLTLLGTSCPVLTTGNSNNSNITITGSGEVAVAASCSGAITLGNNSSIFGQGIETKDPTPGSTVVVMNGTAPPATTVNNVTDTFSNLPSAPPSALASQPASCTVGAGGLATCSPGYYATDPGTTLGATTLDFTGGVYTFAAGLSLGTGQTADFTQGIYTFDGPGGTALSDVGGTINGDPGGQLFYFQSGGVNFGNNSYINSLAGLTSYQGVSYDGIAIWDAAATGLTNPVVLSSNSSNSTYTGGGFYVPNGTIEASNNFSISATFMVALTASLNENNGVTLGP